VWKCNGEMEKGKEKGRWLIRKIDRHTGSINQSCMVGQESLLL
jgi:hypothetical protein